VKSIQEIINIFLYIIKYVNLIASQYFTEIKAKNGKERVLGEWSVQGNSSVLT